MASVPPAMVNPPRNGLFWKLEARDSVIVPVPVLTTDRVPPPVMNSPPKLVLVLSPPSVSTRSPFPAEMKPLEPASEPIVSSW